MDSNIIPTIGEKMVLVTGGNTGIGYGIVSALTVQKPACIYLCARDSTKAQAAIARLHLEHSDVRIEFLELDLSSMASVQECASKFISSNKRLDLLFLNAGISSRAPGLLTKDRYELHFGVNYLGHALLTQLLLPTMQATANDYAADVRVVAVSSISAHLFAPPGGLALLEMKGISKKAEEWSAVMRYGHSKLAMTLMMRALALRYPDIAFVSLCPGNVQTDLWSHTDGLGWLTNWVIAPLVLWLTGITVDEAVKLPLWCASARRGMEQGELKSGVFYNGIGKVKADNANFNDSDLRDKLWNWTEEELRQHGGSGWPQS